MGAGRPDNSWSSTLGAEELGDESEDPLPGLGIGQRPDRDHDSVGTGGDVNVRAGCRVVAAAKDDRRLLLIRDTEPGEAGCPFEPRAQQRRSFPDANPRLRTSGHCTMMEGAESSKHWVELPISSGGGFGPVAP